MGIFGCMHPLRLLPLLLLVAFFQSARAQEATPLLWDLDRDRVMDTIYFDAARRVIVCRLSTKGFQEIMSQPIELGTPQAKIRAWRGGFEFADHFMRAGYTAQFRYEPKIKEIRLIGLTRYELGNAANDGSGEDSYNLLTNDYIGEWHYFDHEKNKLIRLPAIKTKMRFPKTYLQDFSDGTYFDYAGKSAELYQKAKEKHQAGKR